MTDVVVTSDGLNVTGTVTPTVNATAVGLKVSGVVGVPINVSGVGLKVTGTVGVDLRISEMVVKVTALAPPSAGCATSLAQFVEIVRLDGVTMRFTSLDRDFVWGGNLYSACAGMDATAVELNADLQAANMEILGLIDSDLITVADIQAGLFDNASYRVFLADFISAGTPVQMLLSGRIGKVSSSQGQYVAELLSPAKLLEQRPTPSYAPWCRHDFGGAYGDATKAGCKYNVAGTEVSGTVTAATVSRRVLVASGLSQANDYWTHGVVTFTSGDNAGQVRRVKGFGGGTVEFWEELPYALAAGDAFAIRLGCARTLTACKAYGQILNFGGWEHLPGTDRLIKTPDPRL